MKKRRFLLVALIPIGSVLVLGGVAAGLASAAASEESQRELRTAAAQADVSEYAMQNGSPGSYVLDNGSVLVRVPSSATGNGLDAASFGKFAVDVTLAPTNVTRDVLDDLAEMSRAIANEGIGSHSIGIRYEPATDTLYLVTELPADRYASIMQKYGELITIEAETIRGQPG